MTITSATRATTPHAIASAAVHVGLPAGDDERVAGFGVMGLPFASGHYLAFRDFPLVSFAPGYRAVWHRDPDGAWTFYATAPGHLSCARYFSAATSIEPVQCDIAVDWATPWSPAISIDGILDWRVDMKSTPATRVMSAMGAVLPAAAWDSRAMLRAMGPVVGPVLGVGAVRLCGSVPNRQRFRMAPKTVWAVDDATAVLRGVDLGPIGPLREQARLADFRLPQRGICVVGHARFATA